MPRCKIGEDCIGWFCDSRQSWIRCLKKIMENAVTEKIINLF